MVMLACCKQLNVDNTLERAYHTFASPPSFVLIKTRMKKLTGGIPVQPVVKTFRVTLEEGSKIRTISRMQLPVTSAYAITDYHSQRQTIPHDIASPPSGGLSLFNVYVALCRSPGREGIRLLRVYTYQ